MIIKNYNPDAGVCNGTLCELILCTRNLAQVSACPLEYRRINWRLIEKTGALNNRKIRWANRSTATIVVPRVPRKLRITVRFYSSTVPNDSRILCFCAQVTGPIIRCDRHCCRAGELRPWTTVHCVQSNVRMAQNQCFATREWWISGQFSLLSLLINLCCVCWLPIHYDVIIQNRDKTSEK